MDKCDNAHSADFHPSLRGTSAYKSKSAYYKRPELRKVERRRAKANLRKFY